MATPRVRGSQFAVHNQPAPISPRLAKALRTANARGELLPLLTRLAERHAEASEQLAGLIIVRRGGDDRDIHALRVLDLIGLDLGEDDLFGQAEGVVAVTVEAVRVHAAEVADSRQGDG